MREKLAEVAKGLNVGHMMMLLHFGNMSKETVHEEHDALREGSDAVTCKRLFSEWEDRWWIEPLAPDGPARAAARDAADGEGEVMQERTIPIRGDMFQAHIREYGAPSSEPLLFLHGSGGAFADHYLDMLGEKFHVIAPEHPGFGESTGLEHVDDIIDLAIYYYDFMDALGIESAHVVGHSLGGMLAAEMAALDPQSRAPARPRQPDRPLARRSRPRSTSCPRIP